MEPNDKGAGATPPEGKAGPAPEDKDGKTGMTPEELAEHRERSQLGRRVSAMEDNMKAFMAQVGNAVERLEALGQPKGAGTYDAMHSVGMTAPSSADDDDLVTRGDFRTMLAEHEHETTKKHAEYETKYIAHLNTLKVEDPENHEAVVNEMLANYNGKYSDDPVADAERNYFRAAKSVMKKGIKPNPLKGSTNPPALGVGGDTPDKDKDTAVPKLDEIAQEFVNKMGLDETFVKEALKE